ncbi:MAG: hypothetical protein EXS18_04620 [Verrucomicrobiae bacterium]|nr:hypothetical protein [Verrucomicrobiae bacterium]
MRNHIDQIAIGLCVFCLARWCVASNPPEQGEVVLADFEDGADDWSTEVNSYREATSEKANHGKWSLKWTLRSDGANAYGNSLVLAVKQKDWSNYRALKLDFFPVGKVSGRIGCQLTVGTNTLTLADVHPQVVQGEWKTVELQLPAEDLRDVRELRFFFNALEYPQGDHVFYVDIVRLLVKEKPRSEFKRGTPMPSFSSLKADEQDVIRKAVAPPPLGKRRNPYSTPMYYPMWGGTSFDGTLHEDWQEALVKEWAEIGMTKLHFYQYPNGVGTEKREYTLSQADREGIPMFVRLCRKYDIKLGLRVDLPYTLDNSSEHPNADYWIAHPNNSGNELKPYWVWLSEVVTLLKGHLEYVILGDEIDWKQQDKEKAWSADLYMKVFTQAADTIHKADPAAKVSMYGASSGRWNEVLGLLQSGYTKYGDAIAINHYDYTMLRGFKDDLKKYSPDKKLLLLSNGVGYISSDTTQRNPAKDPYSRYNDLDQAAMIARTMYTWWDVDADVAPYYICLRGYSYKGKYNPWWYGFFGFMDLIIDENDKATVKHYPGWYAYQTVANVFHDRDAFREPAFAVESESKAEFLKAHERKGKELLIMAWGKGTTNIRIHTTQYGNPVQVSVLDHQKWSDVSATKDAEGITLHDVPLTLAPTILRLVSQ